MLSAEYGAAGDFLWRRVVVDPVARTVTFHRCHAPRRFWSWGVDPEYTCGLSELRGVCWDHSKGVGQTLEVVTPTGRASLPQSSSGFEEVRVAMVAGMGPGARLPWYEYPVAKVLIILLVYIPCGLACLSLAWWLANRLGTVPEWAWFGALIAAMSMFFVIPLVSYWRGRPNT